MYGFHIHIYMYVYISSNLFTVQYIYSWVTVHIIYEYIYIYSPFCSTKPTNASSDVGPCRLRLYRLSDDNYVCTPYDVQQVVYPQSHKHQTSHQTTQSTFIITQGTQPTFVFLDCCFSVLLSSIILNYFSSRITNKAL